MLWTMDEVVVAAAAIVHSDRLLIAKRWNPAPVAGGRSLGTARR